ncbi:tRNA glutamyl-Q(34) synthetase GluQRS [Agaribacter flavus]|uniref:tRNA glutamyl-Q(34) synthetase GluQRS n=1 Tax=Agaribacter flavus TaxID=1902781 RepID=A0ABV7FV80_9ALTE
MNASSDFSSRQTIGRFAPSSTGPLHFGSLVCALLSYIMAKREQGKWLVRIEDVDRERCKDKYADSILRTLEAHGLLWDGEVVYQSKRSEIYRAYLAKFEAKEYLYGCNCSRKAIKSRADHYDQYCRTRNIPLTEHALRFKNPGDIQSFADLFLGQATIQNYLTYEDPVLKRADGISAYHLAVVADDIEQSITQVVRGMDLLSVTPLHIQLYKALSHVQPSYAHFPLAVHSAGVKYAKQAFSTPIDNNMFLQNLHACLEFIGIHHTRIPKTTASPELLSWSIDNWHPDLLPKHAEIIVSEANGIYSVMKP